MANVFEITAASDKVTPDNHGHAEITFNVSNSTDRQLMGRAKVVGDGPAAFIVPDAERSFRPRGDVQQYAVTLTIPPGTPPGKHKFHLLVMNVANPDEDYTDGPTVGYEVITTGPNPTPPIPWWIFVVAGGVLLILISVLLYLFWPQSKVPKVVDLPVAEAIAQLKKKGLTADIENVRSDKTPNTIVDQDPQAGAKLPEDRKVKLKVAASVEFVAVPSVIGMPRAEAERVLKGLGFRIDQVQPDIQGTVFDQNPRQGTKVIAASTGVTLKVK